MAYNRIDYSEEKKKYDAFEEIAEIKMKKCDHTGVTIVNGELRCKCGMVWSGSRIGELYKLFTENGQK